MKAKPIMAVTLLVVITLSGCSQGNGRTINPADEVSAAPVQTAELIVISEDSAASAQSISFSAGNKTPLPTDMPEPTPSAELSVTAKPNQVQGKSTPAEMAAPTPKTTPKPTVSLRPTAPPKQSAAPKPTAAPTPIVTPKPTAKPLPPVIPTPMVTHTPTATPAQTAMPTPTAKPEPPQIFVPAPSKGQTICNTCGADITGNIAAHGDGHLLSGENFSYRME